MSTSKTVAALNTLLNGELAAFHLYMQASAWCAMNHLDGSRTFFAKHADEELVHFGKIFSYLVEVDAPIHLTALPEPKVAATSIDDLIEQVRVHEQHVTRRSPNRSTPPAPRTIIPPSSSCSGSSPSSARRPTCSARSTIVWR